MLTPEQRIEAPMKRFWLEKIHPVFKGVDEKTGEEVEFKNWRENIVDVMAKNIEDAKEVAALTGFLENVHYNDIIEVK